MGRASSPLQAERPGAAGGGVDNGPEPRQGVMGGGSGDRITPKAYSFSPPPFLILMAASGQNVR